MRLPWVEGNVFDVFINKLVDKISVDNSFYPSNTNGSEISILGNEQVFLSLSYKSNDDIVLKGLYSVPNEIVYLTLFKSSHEVELEIYDIDEENYHLSLISCSKWRDRETVCLKKMQTYKINTQGTACWSKLSIGHSEEAIHVFNASDLEYLCMLSLEANPSRCYFIAKVAGQMNVQQALPILKKLITHKDYNVRWAALQEMFNFEEADAFEILKGFRLDSNKYIAKKAKSEYERIHSILEGK